MHGASLPSHFDLIGQLPVRQADAPAPPAPPERTATFGVFALDLATGELRRNGRTVPLPNQSFRVLRRLLERAGDLVTREELREELWPDGTCVDFEHGLHAAVHKLRIALRGRGAGRVRIQTLPGRGYRFAGEVRLPAAFPDPPGAPGEKERRARFHLERRTPHDLRRALALFAELTGSAPASASARAGLASAWVLAVDFGVCPAGEGLARAEAEATRALGLDPGRAEARAALGFVAHRGQRDWGRAESEYRAAVRAAPDDIRVRQRFAEFLSQLGRHGEAIRHIERARSRDPVDRVAATVHAWILYHARRWAEARDVCNSVLELDPGFELARFVLGRVELAVGRCAAAAEQLEGAVTSPWAAASLALAQAACGDRLGVARTAGALGEPGTAPYLLAKVRLAQGRRSAALGCLEESSRMRDVWLADARVDPEMDPLRDEPRFRVVLGALGAA